MAIGNCCQSEPHTSSELLIGLFMLRKRHPPHPTTLPSTPSTNPTPDLSALLIIIPFILSILLLVFVIINHLFSRSLLPSLLSLPSSLFSKAPRLGPKTSVESLHQTLTSLSNYRSSQLSSLAAKKRSFRESDDLGKRYGAGLGYDQKIQDVRECVGVNSDLVEGLIGVGKKGFEGGYGWRRELRGKGEPGRVVEVLKQFVGPLQSLLWEQKLCNLRIYFLVVGLGVWFLQFCEGLECRRTS